MLMERQISNHFTEFSTIFRKITSNEYSDEQKYEMMEFFRTQTEEKHLELINKLALNSSENLDKIGETAIAVLDNDKEADYQCKDLFLSLLDGAISSVLSHGSTPRRYQDCSRRPVVSNTAYLDGEVDNYRRKNDKLLQEVQMLRIELEEKMLMLDKLEIKNRNLSSLKEQLGRVLEKCSELETENDALKSQINQDQSLLREKVRSEEKMKNEINSLKDSISVKRYLIKSFENEKEIMITDFQLLSEEVVERDLIIQSMNDNLSKGQEEENLAFLLDTASESNFSGLHFK